MRAPCRLYRGASGLSPAWVISCLPAFLLVYLQVCLGGRRFPSVHCVGDPGGHFGSVAVSRCPVRASEQQQAQERGRPGETGFLSSEVRTEIIDDREISCAVFGLIPPGRYAEVSVVLGFTAGEWTLVFIAARQQGQTTVRGLLAPRVFPWEEISLYPPKQNISSVEYTCQVLTYLDILYVSLSMLPSVSILFVHEKVFRPIEYIDIR